MQIHLDIHDDNERDCTSVSIRQDGIYVNIANATQASAPQDLMDCVLEQVSLAKRLSDDLLRNGDVVGGCHVEQEFKGSLPADHADDL